MCSASQFPLSKNALPNRGLTPLGPVAKLTHYNQ